MGGLAGKLHATDISGSPKEVFCFVCFAICFLLNFCSGLVVA